jgi:hypothetical protein
VKKPVSKFAFQVHNLQRYTVVLPEDCPLKAHGRCWGVVGRCTLNQVDQ